MQCCSSAGGRAAGGTRTPGASRSEIENRTTSPPPGAGRGDGSPARQHRELSLAAATLAATCPSGCSRVGCVSCKGNNGRRRRMSEIQYRTAKNIKEAVALMAAAKGKGYILAGGTDLLVQMRSGRREPDHRRHQEDPRHHRHPRGGRRLRDRRRHARRRGRRARGLEQGLARRGRGARPDRLDPGPGPRHAGRQPVQRLAGRRQRAGADRRRARSPSSSAPRAGARCRSRRSSPARARPRWPRASSSSRFILPPRPARTRRRLSALHPAHRDGHRRGRRRRQPDARRRRHLHRAPASASARWRRPCCWSTRRPRR